MDDADLVQRCREGDPAAFDALVRRHHATVQRIARRFADTREDADDLAQEAFFAAYEHLPKLAAPARFGPWLASIALNQGRQWLRRRMAQPALYGLDETEAALAGAALAAAREADGRAALRGRIAEALAALTAEQHRALELHYLDGHSYRETALLLGVPVGAVRGRLDRARNVLRRELGVMDTSWELGARELEALRDAAGFASHDPDKAPLNAVCFTGTGELVATDTHRLFCAAAPCLAALPRLVVDAELGRALAEQAPSARQGRLTVEDGTVVLRVDSRALQARQVDAAYPQWQRVVPESFACRATAPLADWLAALALLAAYRSTAPASPEPPRMLLTVSPPDGTLTLTDGQARGDGRRVGWEARATFAAAVAGDALSLAANPIYVEQALRALHLPEDGLVELAANSEHHPFRLRAANGEGTFVVTMPMQREAAL